MQLGTNTLQCVCFVCVVFRIEPGCSRVSSETERPKTALQAVANHNQHAVVEILPWIFADLTSMSFFVVLRLISARNRRNISTWWPQNEEATFWYKD